MQVHRCPFVGRCAACDAVDVPEAPNFYSHSMDPMSDQKRAWRAGFAAAVVTFRQSLQAPPHEHRWSHWSVSGPHLYRRCVDPACGESDRKPR